MGPKRPKFHESGTQVGSELYLAMFSLSYCIFYFFHFNKDIQKCVYTKFQTFSTDRLGPVAKKVPDWS